jgi:hypothetical protein
VAKQHSGSFVWNLFKDLVAAHPRLAATLAFELGFIVAQAAKNPDKARAALKNGIETAPRRLAALFTAPSKPQLKMLWDVAPSLQPKHPKNARTKKARRRSRRAGDAKIEPSAGA